MELVVGVFSIVSARNGGVLINIIPTNNPELLQQKTLLSYHRTKRIRIESSTTQSIHTCRFQ